MATIAKALQTGFYDGKRRREGEVFPVKDGATAAWFEIVESDVVKPKAGKKAKADPVKAEAPAEAPAEEVVEQSESAPAETAEASQE